MQMRGEKLPVKASAAKALMLGLLFCAFTAPAHSELIFSSVYVETRGGQEFDEPPFGDELLDLISFQLVSTTPILDTIDISGILLTFDDDSVQQDTSVPIQVASNGPTVTDNMVGETAPNSNFFFTSFQFQNFGIGGGLQIAFDLDDVNRLVPGDNEFRDVDGTALDVFYSVNGGETLTASTTYGPCDPQNVDCATASVALPIPTASVPAPATLALLGLGLLAIGRRIRK